MRSSLPFSTLQTVSYSSTSAHKCVSAHVVCGITSLKLNSIEINIHTRTHTQNTHNRLTTERLNDETPGCRMSHHTEIKTW